MNLLRDLSIHEPADLFNFLRMDISAFEYLQSKVKRLIEKENTVMRYAVSPREHLTKTLRYLASGNSYENLKFLSAVSPQLLGKIIPETCWAIFKTMKQEFLKVRLTFIEIPENYFFFAVIICIFLFCVCITNNSWV